MTRPRSIRPARRGFLPRRAAASAAVVALLMTGTGCASPRTTQERARELAAGARPRVVASTAVLADITRSVGGDDVDVTAIVPAGADPHSYEPTLRTVRDVARADLALTNYLLLEERSIIRAIEANLAPGVPQMALAESASRYGGEVLPLVEDAALDTVWLGVRVHGAHGAGIDRSAEVRLSITGVEGPGSAAAFVSGTFGRPDVFFASSDGFDAATGFRDDTLTLPVDAHTHMSWAFTHPGVYHLHTRATLTRRPGAVAERLGDAVLTVAVGVDPAGAVPGRAVVGQGHADVAVDLTTGRTVLHVDAPPGSGAPARDLDLDRAVVEVPTRALGQVPADPAYRFVSRPGDPAYVLAQAVLGKHVHGDIDPHLWHDVRNVKAYAQLVRDSLVQVDPTRAAGYRRRTQDYLATLDHLDREVRAVIGQIPASRRRLVTTHDAFAYLAHAYGLRVTGFVTPTAAGEPSVADRTRLVRTLQDLKVPAVFAEPVPSPRRADLVEAARAAGVQVCPILGDTFVGDVRTYPDLMRFNADSLRRCLAPPGSAPTSAQSPPAGRPTVTPATSFKDTSPR